MFKIFSIVFIMPILYGCASPEPTYYSYSLCSEKVEESFRGSDRTISRTIPPSYYKKKDNHKALVYNKKTNMCYSESGKTNVSAAVVQSVLECKKGSDSFSDCLTVAIDDRYFGGRYLASCEPTVNGDYKSVKHAKAIVYSPSRLGGVGRCYTGISKKAVKTDYTNVLDYTIAVQVKGKVSTAMGMAMSNCLKESKNCVFYDINGETIKWKSFGVPVYRYIGDVLVPPRKNR